MVTEVALEVAQDRVVAAPAEIDEGEAVKAVITGVGVCPPPAVSA
jgi:hypothetical protein